MKTRFAIVTCLVLAAAMLAGCGPKFDQMTAEELFGYGKDKFDHKKYQDAIDAYEALVDLYPFSMYVTDAELGIADSHFFKRQWVEAEAAYDAFAQRHPSHAEIDRVYFRMGMANYKQKLAIDRDQANTQRAEAQFSKVVSRYPDSEYYNEARLKLAEVRNDLAERERYVAKHYWRNKEYYAAYKRYERVIQLYADTKYFEEALYYGARCLLELDERDDARRLLELSLRKFPEGKYANRVADLLAKMP